MQHLIKKIIDAEFAANDMEVVARVEPKAWQQNKIVNYQIKLLFRGGQNFMEVTCAANRPFMPKVNPVRPIEPHKLIRLCEIIQESFNELERKVSMDDFK